MVKFVVDTNILFSFFRNNPVRFIIISAKLLDLELFSPEWTIEELKNKLYDVKKYSGLGNREIDFAFEELKKSIKMVHESSYNEFKSEAGKLVHEKDVPFFALALKLNCGIWSNEPAFKNQERIKIFNTQNLREFLGFS